ncbi:SH3 domain-containing protein [Streptomyces roseolilacinus]|uniref:hypothetical protein n=1 Tax=Streptomyces roseolilacinus TaxID=66904 RepID=UPI003821D342
MAFAAPADDLVLDDFRPTHVVPRHGMPAWETPGTARPTVPLDPFLPVQLLERMGDWARVLCSNGWSAWVDGRLLVSVPEDPPAAARDMARAADPRPLLARAEASLGRYRRAAEDLAAGRTDGEGFRRGTGGLRLGVVVEGEAMWLYDAEHERWLYCDGTRLAEYATSSTPSANPPPVRTPERAAPPPEDGGGREPTRVVGAAQDAAPAGRGAGSGPSRGSGGHEPAPPAGTGRQPAPDTSGGSHASATGHEPTRVVTTGPGPGATRIVPAEEDGGEAEDGPRPAGSRERPAAAEPTRPVDVPGTDHGGTADDRAGDG